MAKLFQNIDIHVHLAAFPTTNNKCFISKKMLKSFLFRFLIWRLKLPSEEPEKANRMYVDRLLDALKSSQYIRRAIILGMDGQYGNDGKFDRQNTEFLINNDYVLSLCKQYPDFLLPGVSINPQRHDALEELERCVREGAVLVKVLPNTQHFNPAEERYSPFYRALAAHQIPLLCHVGYEYSLKGESQSLGDPIHLKVPLDHGVTVIAAHGMSRGLFFYEKYWKTFIEYVNRYPNFYWDASALSLPNRVGMLLRLRKHPELQERMIFGTDYPLPCFAYPALLAGQWKAYKKLRRIKSPFDRHFRLLQLLGFSC